MISSEFEELAEGAQRVVIMHEGHATRVLDNPGLTEDALVTAIATAQHDRGDGARHDDGAPPQAAPLPDHQETAP
jgi:ribose transport system ATP-binding protein